jgi:penicillin-binding protein 1A
MFTRPDHKTGTAPYFREIVRKRTTEILKEKDKKGNYLIANEHNEPYDIYTDGLKIITTIDYRLQVHAEEAVSNYLGSKLQKIFFNDLKKRKNWPFSNAISSSNQKSILKLEIRKSQRFRRLTGRECHNCGRTSITSKFEKGVKVFVCKAEDCKNEFNETSQDKIDEIFNTPVKMKVFTWDGEKDTTLTPRDSILYYLSILQSGLLSIDPTSGYIKAWVGGINKTHFSYDHVYQSKRQVGSTFKPFLYALAINEGIMPCHEIPNISYVVSEGKWGLLKPWQPGYSPKFNGMINFKFGLANSMNNVAVYLMNQFGPTALIDFAHKMGIKSKLDTVPSLCLGVTELSLYEMVSSYCAFAELGIHKDPIFIKRIEDRHGNVIVNYEPEQYRAINENTAYTTLQLMKGVADGIYNKDYNARKGTGYYRIRTLYKMKTPIAGKTGTTQRNSDGWFIGLTPDLVTGIWVGAESPGVRFSTTTLGQGANTALPIWAIYMNSIYNDKNISISKGDFKKPENYDSSILNCDSVQNNNVMQEL